MATKIRYNGSVIAAPGVGRTATLKCEGMKMESDVVVEVSGDGGGSDSVIVPLTITENGTYSVGHSVVTEEWDVDTVYDFELNVDGMLLKLKKSDKLVVPDSIEEFNKDEYGDIAYIMTSLDDDNGESLCYVPKVFGEIVPFVIFVKNAALLNLMYNTDAIEDNTVYLTNLFEVTGGMEAPWSVTGPGVLADGYLPVTVDVKTKWQDITATENGVYTAGFDDYYLRQVTVKYSQKEFVDLVAGTLVETPTWLRDIRTRAFAYCTSLQRVLFNDGECTIEHSAFLQCKNLTQVFNKNYGKNYIYIGTKTLGASAFDTSGLTGDLTIEGNNLGGSAFESCTNLKSVLIDHIFGISATIGTRAFYYCSNLTDVIIYPRLSYHNEQSFIIASRAFEGCNSLKSLWLLAAIPEDCTLADDLNMFPSNLENIYLPDYAVDAFKSASGWSNFASKIKPWPTFSVTIMLDKASISSCKGIILFDRYNTASNITITDGMTIEVTGGLQISPDLSYCSNYKIGTSAGADDVARGTKYDSTKFFPRSDVTLYITGTDHDWYENEIAPL